MSKTLRTIIRAMDVARPKLHKVARQLALSKKKSGRKKRRTRKSK